MSTTPAQKNFWGRLRAFKLSTLIHLGTLVMLIIPVLVPLGLPFKITSDARNFYDEVEKLQPGSAVFYANDITPQQLPEIMPQEIAVLTHLFRKDARVIIVTSQTAAAVELMQTSILPKVDLRGKEYGRDYVNLGWIPGGETGLAAFAKDIRSVMRTDINGTLTDAIPMMKNVNSIKDVSLLLCFVGDWGNMYLRQWWALEKTPTVMGVAAIQYPTFQAYLNAHQILGLLNGITGGAQYERLINRPGLGISTLDDINVGYMWVLMLVLVGNIRYFAARAGLIGKQKEARR